MRQALRWNTNSSGYLTCGWQDEEVGSETTELKRDDITYLRCARSDVRAEPTNQHDYVEVSRTVGGGGDDHISKTTRMAVACLLGAILMI